MNVFGIVGRATSGTVKPINVNITPMNAVISKPKKTAKGTFFMNRINVIIIPIVARNTGGDEILPNETMFMGLDTIIPAFTTPRKARKNPIPAPIANFKSFGNSFNIASLNPLTVIIKNSMLDKNTAASAAFQDKPISRTIV